MQYWKSAFVLLFLSVYSVHSIAEEVSLRADYWYPYNGDPDSIKPGYMVEIAKLALEEAGYTVDYQLMPWDAAIESVNKGSVDCLVGPTKKEAPNLLYPSIAFGVAHTGFYSRFGELGSWRYEGVHSFKDVRVGVTESVVYIEDDEVIQYLASEENNVFIAKGDKSLIELMGALAKGDIDLVLETSAVFKAFSREQGVFLLFTEVDNLNDGNPVYLACSPKNAHAQKYVDLFSRQLMAMRKSGDLKVLLKKYGLRDWMK